MSICELEVMVPYFITLIQGILLSVVNSLQWALNGGLWSTFQLAFLRYVGMQVDQRQQAVHSMTGKVSIHGEYYSLLAS